jgi:hypothetical protein
MRLKLTAPLQWGLLAEQGPRDEQKALQSSAAKSLAACAAWAFVSPDPPAVTP